MAYESSKSLRQYRSAWNHIQITKWNAESRMGNTLYFLWKKYYINFFLDYYLSLKPFLLNQLLEYRNRFFDIILKVF